VIASATLDAGAGADNHFSMPSSTRRRARRARSRPEPDEEQCPGPDLEQQLYNDKEVWHYINPRVGYCQIWPARDYTQPRFWRPVAFYWNHNRSQWQPYRWQEIMPPPFVEWHKEAPFRSASEISSDSSSAGSDDCYMLDCPNETDWVWRDGIGTCRVESWSSQTFWKPTRFRWIHHRHEWQPYRFTPVHRHS